MILAPNRIWTDEELNKLKDLWGNKPIRVIARRLNRTETAVIVKAKRLKLGSPSCAGDYLNANRIAMIMGVDCRTVTGYWVDKCGLKASREVMRQGKISWLINYEAFIKWLKKNQDKWDSRKVELYALGYEPDWLIDKRQRDKEIPKRRFAKWTKTEDARAVYMFKKGKSKAEIAEALNRSACSVDHRLSRLDIWGDGSYIGDRRTKVHKTTERKAII